MIVDMMPYSNSVLSRFAKEEWGKALAFLRRSFPYLSYDDCEDIFQDSFITLYDNNRAGKLKDMASSLSTYFLAICKNKAFELLRKRGTQVTTDEDGKLDMLDSVKEEKADVLLTFDTDASLIEAKEAIARQIVHDLPHPCDKLLWGFFRDNYTIKALAEMLGKTEGYVKVTKHRCQEKFRVRWTELAKNLY